MKICAMGIFLGVVFLALSSVQDAVTDIPCTRNRTDTCISNLATFTTIDQPQFSDTITSLDEICRNASYGVQCTTEFLQDINCGNEQERFKLNDQINRSKDVYRLLCRNDDYSAFKKEYMNLSPCIANQSIQFKICYTDAHVPDSPELIISENASTVEEKYKKTCCLTEKYIQCSENAIGGKCGETSKNVVSTLLTETIGQRLNDFCLSVERTNNSINETCSSSGHNPVTPVAIIVFCAYLLYMIFMF